MKPFAELAGKNKAIEVTRWLSVVPAAMLGGFLGPVIVTATVGSVIRLTEYAGLLVFTGISEMLLLTLMLNFPRPLGFVLAGSLMAPGWRIATATVLAVAGITLSLRLHVTGQYLGGNSLGLINFMHFGGETLGALFAAACIRRWENRKK